MTYTTVDAALMKPVPGPHPAASPHDKGVGEALGIRAFGLYQVELPPGGETVRHDHISDGAEDVYAILHGTGAWHRRRHRRRPAGARAAGAVHRGDTRLGAARSRR